MEASGRFGLAGIMGWPVAHSRSPRLHGFWLEAYGTAGAYVPLPVDPGRLEAAIRGLAALGFAGCNVTVPHKEGVLRLVDRVDPVARRIGAVNCVVVGADGTLDGYNFDAFGFRESLRQGCPDWSAQAGPCVVLGAGGSARAVVDSLVQAGAPEIRLLNRTRSRAEALAADLGGGPIRVLSWETRQAALEGAGLLVNTTTQGMIGQPPLDLRLDALPHRAAVADLVYVPLETPLLAAARARGNAVLNGLGMLLHQARPAFRAWYGIMPEVTPALRRAIEATL